LNIPGKETKQKQIPEIPNSGKKKLKREGVSYSKRVQICIGSTKRKYFPLSTTELNPKILKESKPLLNQ
jgi:predicted SprT family Zn-dependent metalloprotease